MKLYFILLSFLWLTGCFQVRGDIGYQSANFVNTSNANEVGTSFPYRLGGYLTTAWPIPIMVGGYYEYDHLRFPNEYGYDDVRGNLLIEDNILGVYWNSDNPLSRYYWYVRYSHYPWRKEQPSDLNFYSVKKGDVSYEYASKTYNRFALGYEQMYYVKEAQTNGELHYASTFIDLGYTIQNLELSPLTDSNISVEGVKTSFTRHEVTLSVGLSFTSSFIRLVRAVSKN